MADTPYERVKGGRLTFKGGAIATNSKAISKKKKKNKNKQSSGAVDDGVVAVDSGVGGAGGGEGVYTIDAAKKMKYEELFPVETKKFGYDPNAAKQNSVELALDDRIKKKADRYCK